VGIFLFKLRRISPDPVIDQSLRHSVKDGLAYSFMIGAGESYFSVFALFFKASNAQIGVLASLPALLGAFMQLFSAWLGRHGRSRRTLILFGVSMQALMMLPVLVLPLLFPKQAIPILITCVIFYYASVNLASPQWWSLMGDIVPEHRRGRFFAMRTRLCSLMAFIAFVAGGLVLHGFDALNKTAWGFVILFTLAMLARFVSIYHLRKMYAPPGHVAALESPFQKNIFRRIRGSAMARFSIFIASMQFSVAVASPFFIVYMLRDLQLSYLQYTSITATMILSQYLTLPRWGRVCDIFGNRVVLLFCGSIIPLMPLFWLVSTNLGYLLVVQIIGGVVWAGFALSSGNFIYELVPATKRVTYLALHNVLTGIAVFGGALLGGLLSEHLPKSLSLGSWQLQWFSVFYGVFILSTLLRIGVAIYFLPRVHEIRQVKTLSWQSLLRQVLRLRSRRRLAVTLSRMRKNLTLRSRV
jgi:MFS family permease